MGAAAAAVAAAESRASNYECATRVDGWTGEETIAGVGGVARGGVKEKRRGFRAFVMENGGKY